MFERALLLAALAPALLLAPRAEALPIIQEIYYDEPGTDGNGVFTEIYGLPGMDLTGWSMIGINGADSMVYRTVDLTGAVIPADGLLVIATATADASLVPIRDFVGNVDWQNAPDAVQLLDPMSNVVDAVLYGSSFGPFGEGNPAPDVGAGSSLTRDMLGTDTNDNASDFSASAPSPGVGPAPIPEPSTALLLATGLLALAAARRR